MKKLKCFACNKVLGQNPKLVRCVDEQTVYVGSECYKKIVKAHDGYQPSKGGPKLYLIDAILPIRLKDNYS